MPNKANFRKSQIFITLISTTSYSGKMKLDTWSKRTQTKPILPAVAGKIALSEVEGPMQGRIYFFNPNGTRGRKANIFKSCRVLHRYAC